MHISIPLKGRIVLPKSSIRPGISIQGLSDEICSSLGTMRARSIRCEEGQISFSGGDFQGVSSPLGTIDRGSIKIMEGEENITLQYKIYAAWLYILFFIPFLIYFSISFKTDSPNIFGARFFVPIFFMIFAFFVNIIYTYIVFPTVLESHLQNYLKTQK
jgi:hypothetical protein